MEFPWKEDKEMEAQQKDNYPFRRLGIDVLDRYLHNKRIPRTVYAGSGHAVA